MRINFFGDTDVGQVRQINEDAYLLLPEAAVCVVCDGMGGHAAGEVASGEARKVFAAYFHGGSEQWQEQLHFGQEEHWPTGGQHLVRATRLANRSIHNIAAEKDSARGMGTTVVSLAFDPGIVSICHVGDSRAYRLRDGAMERLTVDHSLAAELIAQNELTEEESKHFAERNVITRALGTRPEVDVDLRVEETKTGDVFLACSDGLCGFVEDELIKQILLEAGTDYPTAIKNLLNAANATGGEDNITVAIAQVDDPGTAAEAAGRDAQTILAIEGPGGEILDEVLPAIKAVELPDEDTQKINLDSVDTTPQAQKPPAGGGGSSGRLWRWLALLVVLTAIIFLGGKQYLWSERNGDVKSAKSDSEKLMAADDPGTVFFEHVTAEAAGATVYVDGEYRGVAGHFAESGLSLRRGLRHIHCVLDTTVLHDTIIQISRDTTILPLSLQAD